MIKMDCWKNTTYNIKTWKTTNKNWEKSGTTYCLGCKDYTDNFKPQEIKMSLDKNQTVLFVDLVNHDF